MNLIASRRLFTRCPTPINSLGDIPEYQRAFYQAGFDLSELTALRYGYKSIEISFPGGEGDDEMGSELAWAASVGEAESEYNQQIQTVCSESTFKTIWSSRYDSDTAFAPAPPNTNGFQSGGMTSSTMDDSPYAPGFPSLKSADLTADVSIDFTTVYLVSGLYYPRINFRIAARFWWDAWDEWVWDDDEQQWVPGCEPLGDTEYICVQTTPYMPSGPPDAMMVSIPCTVFGKSIQVAYLKANDDCFFNGGTIELDYGTAW